MFWKTEPYGQVLSTDALVIQIARAAPWHSALTQGGTVLNILGKPAKFYIHMMAASTMTELWQQHNPYQDLEGPEVDSKFPQIKENI